MWGEDEFLFDSWAAAFDQGFSAVCNQLFAVFSEAVEETFTLCVAVLPARRLVSATFAAVQAKHEYRGILQRKMIRDGVIVISRGSGSLVDVHRAIHQARVASTTLAKFSNATTVKDCVASLITYMDELYVQSTAIQDAPEQKELEESPEIEAVANLFAKAHQSAGEWKARSQRNVREKRRILLGSLPSEVIHGYVIEQRLMSLLPWKWQRWVYALLLQQNRTPKLQSIETHAKSRAFLYLKVVFCGLYYILTTSFVIAFHLRQSSPSDVRANKNLYAAAVSNTFLEVTIVGPIWLLVELAIVPMVARLVLRRELQSAISSLEDASAQSGPGSVGLPAKGLLGVSKEKKRLLQLRDRSDRGIDETKTETDRNLTCAHNNNAALPGCSSTSPQENCELSATPNPLTTEDEQGGNGEWTMHTHDEPGERYFHSARLRRATWSEPGEWTQHTDAATGHVFWHNPTGRRSTWTTTEAIVHGEAEAEHNDAPPSAEDKPAFADHGSSAGTEPRGNSGTPKEQTATHLDPTEGASPSRPMDDDGRSGHGEWAMYPHDASGERYFDSARLRRATWPKPDEWTQHTDAAMGDVFWHNPTVRRSTWTTPEAIVHGETEAKHNDAPPSAKDKPAFADHGSSAGTEPRGNSGTPKEQTATHLDPTEGASPSRPMDDDGRSGHGEWAMYPHDASGERYFDSARLRRATWPKPDEWSQHMDAATGGAFWHNPTGRRSTRTSSETIDPAEAPAPEESHHQHDADTRDDREHESRASQDIELGDIYSCTGNDTHIPSPIGGVAGSVSSPRPAGSGREPPLRGETSSEALVFGATNPMHEF